MVPADILTRVTSLIYALRNSTWDGQGEVPPTVYGARYQLACLCHGTSTKDYPPDVGEWLEWSGYVKTGRH